MRHAEPFKHERKNPVRTDRDVCIPRHQLDATRKGERTLTRGGRTRTLVPDDYRDASSDDSWYDEQNRPDPMCDDFAM